MTTVEQPPPRADLDDPELYINRELSWLEFNSRVLHLAQDPDIPLLERCKFMAIFSSNLDEFFMVRVAAVQDAMAAGRPSSTPDRLPREDVLRGIGLRVQELVRKQGAIWRREIRPLLADAGIRIATFDRLQGSERTAIEERFEREVYPVLTPLAVGPGLPFPYISGLSLNLGLTVRDPVEDEVRFARVKVPPRLPRFIAAGDVLVPLESVIEHHVDRLFPGMEVVEAVQFRVTRDADYAISDESDDLLGAVEAQIRRRRFGHVVRLEVADTAPEELVQQLSESLGVRQQDIFRVPLPIDFTGLWQLATMDRPDLRDDPWKAPEEPWLNSDGDPIDIFAAIRRGDLLVHHPYDDFEASVERFVEQAVADPSVLAIRQTMYRTSGDSPIVPALIRAAEQGKQTVCLVEVQARFDEENNIQWARKLERAGVHVVYGLAGLKTHAKLAMVIRREGDRVRRYVHIGTGNYNPTTAKIYTDLGLFTCREDVAEDVANLFNYITGFARQPAYDQVLVAPTYLREGLVAEIDRVAAAHREGTPGRIVIKCNAMLDAGVIEALFRASQAGVPIQMIVRSIAGFRPGVPGVSDTIELRSIVGRYLEHARIFAFTSGGETRAWIGSADMMVRNLDKRVELVTPVDEPALLAELMEVLEIQLADTVLAWQLRSDGTWFRVQPEPGQEPLDSQVELMKRAAAKARREDGPGRS